MKKIFIFSIAIILSNSIFAQSDKLITKLNAEICPCIEKAVEKNPKIGVMEVTQTCMIEAFKNNAEEVGAITDNFKSDAKMRKLGEKVGGNLAQTCPAFTALAVAQAGSLMKDKDKNPFDSTLYSKTDCKAFNSGKFVTVVSYMNGKEVPETDKSAYSLVSNNEWTDVTENGKYKSISTITKTDNCNIALTIKSNTNPKFDSFLKPGFKAELKILGVDKKNPKLFYVIMTFNGMNIYQKIEKKA
jgi:hypothetical protein